MVGMNLYVYCDNDAINRTDPSGLFYKVITKPQSDGSIDVDIQVPLTFDDVPADQQDLPDRQIAAIKKQWNKRIGKYNVRTTVIRDNSRRNIISEKNTKTENGKKMTGFPGLRHQPLYTPMAGLPGHGDWGSVNQGRPHHEFGHLLGLGHGNPNPYPSSNIMGSVQGWDIFNGQRTDYDISVPQIERIIEGSPYPGSFI
jgi:hypothetical protein